MADFAIVTRYLTQNPYFGDGRWLTGDDFTGFFLHSVGCAQPDPLVFIRGWDKPTHTSAGINGFLGYGTAYITAPCLETPGKVKRMPHAGRPANDHYIGFEMCEPKELKYNENGTAFTVAADKLPAARAYVLENYALAVALFAKLCLFHGKDPQAAGVILSHREGALKGIATHHGDPEFLWKGLGLNLTMGGFRQDVAAKMEEMDMTEEKVLQLIKAKVEPLQTKLAAAETALAETKVKLNAAEAKLEAVEKALGPEIKHLDDAPKWMRKQLAELLEFGVINGGTPADVDALDVNKQQAILEAVLMAKKCAERYADSLLLPAVDEETPAE